MFDMKRDFVINHDYHEDYLSTVRRDDSDESRDGVFNFFGNDSMRDLSDSFRDFSGSFCDNSICYAASESSVEVSISGLLSTQQAKCDMMAHDNQNYFPSSVPKVVESRRLIRPNRTYPEKATVSTRKFNPVDKKLAEMIEHLCRPTKSHLSYLSEGPTSAKNAKRDRGPGPTESAGSPTRAEQAKKEGSTFSNEHLLKIVEKVSRPTKSHLSYLYDSPANTTRGTTAGRQSPSNHHFSRRAHSFTSRLRKRGSRISSDEELAQIVEQLCRPTKSHLSYTSEISKMKDKSKETPPTQPRRTDKKTEPQSKQDDRASFQQSIVYKMANEGPKKSVYERLYVERRSAKIPQETSSFEKEPNTGIHLPKRYWCRDSKTKCESNNVAHLRLYDFSKKYQLEGKKLREEIETKKRTKSEMKTSNEKISASRACRLYYVGTESLKLRYR